MADNSKKVGLPGLVAIVFGSMIGGGIFNIPQNMAEGAALGPVIIAWIITGFGMLFLAYTFKSLSNARPDLKSGIYAYANEGFGRYVGFNAAWGYWISAAVGNVAFAVMLNDAFGYFFPVLLNHGWQTIVFGAAMIWLMNIIVQNGLRGASSLNTVSTLAKLIALIVIIVIVAAFFGIHDFKFSFWGEGLKIGTIGRQIRNPMLVTLWCFIGIEGAVVISGRAKNAADVGTATVIGLLLALGLYVSISVLSFGLMHQPELAKLKNPSTGYLLQHVVGNWGITLVNISVIISVGGAWLAWTMLVAEVPFDAAKEGVFPKIFTRENSKKSPSSALILSSLLMTLFMVMVVLAKNVYMAAINIASIMILPPYILSAMYLWKAAETADILKEHRKQRIRAMFIGMVATFYCGWLIYAAGMNYVLLSAIFYTLGIPVYYSAHKDDLKLGKRIFEKRERVLAFIFIIAAIIAVDLLVTGKIHY